MLQQDDNNKDDEAEGPTPLSKRRKTDEMLNNEFQNIHQAFVKIQQMIRPDGAL